MRAGRVAATRVVIFIGDAAGGGGLLECGGLNMSVRLELEGIGSKYLVDWHAACIVLVIPFAEDQVRCNGVLPSASGTAGSRRWWKIVAIEV